MSKVESAVICRKKGKKKFFQNLKKANIITITMLVRYKKIWWNYPVKSSMCFTNEIISTQPSRRFLFQHGLIQTPQCHFTVFIPRMHAALIASLTMLIYCWTFVAQYQGIALKQPVGHSGSVAGVSSICKYRTTLSYKMQLM